MKKIEIFDTISFTPFGTLACPSPPTPPYSVHLLNYVQTPLPRPTPSVLFCHVVCTVLI